MWFAETLPASSPWRLACTIMFHMSRWNLVCKRRGCDVPPTVQRSVLVKPSGQSESSEWSSRSSSSSPELRATKGCRPLVLSPAFLPSADIHPASSSSTPPEHTTHRSSAGLTSYSFVLTLSLCKTMTRVT